MKVLRIFAVGLCFLNGGCNQKDEPALRSQPKGAPQPMPNKLQERAKAYLQRPIPKGMPYIADNLTDGLIARYAGEGKIDSDPEVLELMQLCILEAENAATTPERPPEQQKVFRESAEILRAILAETQERR